MNTFALLLIVLVLPACTQLLIAEAPEYKLTKSDAFIISESPQLWKFGRSLYYRPGRSLEFLVQNSEALEQTILLDKAVAAAGDEIDSIPCVNAGSPNGVHISLTKDQIAKIQCIVSLVPNEKNKLAMKDSIVRIQIPTQTDAKISIEHMFRIEDFQ